jgi:hypothetical protein
MTLLRGQKLFRTVFLVSENEEGNIPCFMRNLEHNIVGRFPLGGLVLCKSLNR